MGLESRQYYRDEGSRSFGFGPSAYGVWSVITILIVVNLAIFLLDAFTPKTDHGLHWLSRNLAIDSSQPWKIWTLLTHGFAHASLDSKIGFWHVAGNMLVLFFLGRAVEERLGRHEFIKFYLMSDPCLGRCPLDLLFDDGKTVGGRGRVGCSFGGGWSVCVSCTPASPYCCFL